jgi:hypothetical protein
MEIYDMEVMISMLVACLTAGPPQRDPPPSYFAPEIPELVKGFHVERMLTCTPGDAPGQYWYGGVSPERLLPTAFTIDAATEDILIAEADPAGKLRVQRFSRSGRLRAAIAPEGKSYSILAVAAAIEGEFMLVLELPSSPLSSIGSYDDKGKLIARYGPEGRFSSEELAAEEQAIRDGVGHRSYPNRHKYFDGMTPKVLFTLPADELLVLPRYSGLDWKSENVKVPGYRFNRRTGRLLAQATRAADLAMPEQFKLRWRRQDEVHYEFLRACREVMVLKTYPAAYYLDEHGRLYEMFACEDKLIIYRITAVA